MKVVGKVFNVIEKTLKMICILLTVAFSVITLASVFARYVMHAPFNWSEQLCRYLFIWSVMLYMPVVMRNGNNLGFDLVVNKFPKAVQQALQLLCMILIDAFAVFYCKYSIDLVVKTMGKKFSGVNWPYWAVYSAQIIGSAILFLFTLEVIINLIIKMKKDKEG